MAQIEHKFFTSIDKIESKKLWNAFENAVFPRTKFLNLLKSAHPFVFDRKCSESAIAKSGIGGSEFLEPDTVAMSWEEQILKKAVLVEEFSLPFKTSLYLLNSETRIARKDTKNRIVKFKRVGYLLHEIKPEKVHVYEIDELEHEGIWFPVPDFMEIDLTKLDKNQASDIVLINRLSDMISVQRLGIEVNAKRSMKTKGIGAGVTVYRYSNVIHVADKVEYEYTAPLMDKINWEFRGFWRGFWRALYFPKEITDQFGRRVVDYTRTGKNRTGVYSEPGYTWVVEHTKGDARFAEIKTHLVKSK